MKIWFGATTLKYRKYEKYYLKIRQYLIDSGHILSNDWIGECGEWIKKNPNTRRDIKNLYQKVIRAIDEADISIIEFTVPNFSTSHQITYSIQKRKATLVLRLNRENTFPDSYIEALDSPYLTIKQYNLKTYQNIIDEFLGWANLETGQGRYNIILDKRHKYYLDWAANKYNKSRSLIIRELLDNKLETDPNFGIYLKGK